MHVAEYPLTIWLEKAIEESSEGHVTLQVITRGAMFMGPVRKTDTKYVYKVTTPMQMSPQNPPVIVEAVFTCDNVLTFIPLSEEILGEEKSQIVT